ncbi:gp53-like domain-containing protein [Dyella sp. KRB-257]|uniref:gp53-like domain-containing protein n=1 Tax=Dyella sp. KRB-257 TaxID=3400915 RepID=UPI003C033B56
MTAFRLFSPFETFFDDAGKVAASGSLAFYDAGTTTPKDVYGEQALTTNNGSTIALGVDGKPVHDIWGSGSYRARLYASDGTLISDRDNLTLPGGGGLTIPTLVDGQFLTNDAANLLWSAILQLPDPTGQDNKILFASAGAALWQSLSALNIPDLTVTTGTNVLSVKIGTLLIQSGKDTLPNSGAYTSSKSVVFPTAYATVFGVTLTPIGAQAGGPVVMYYNAAPSSTGFTAVGDIAEGNSSLANFTATNDFQWIAIGVTA